MAYPLPERVRGKRASGEGVPRCPSGFERGLVRAIMFVDGYEEVEMEMLIPVTIRPVGSRPGGYH